MKRRNALKLVPLALGSILSSGISPSIAQAQKAASSEQSGGGTALGFAPFGIGGGGKTFRDRAMPPTSTVIGVTIRHACGIDSSQLITKNAKGENVPLEKHGGNGGDEETFLLQDGEYIVGISGKTGTGLDSVVIHTNIDDSKRFGGTGGTDSFNLQVPEGCQVIGFGGQAHGTVTKLGVVYRKR